MKLSKQIAILAPFCLGISVFASEAPTAVMPESHFDFLNEYCLTAYDAITEEGNVNLEDLSFNLSTLATAELWQKVLNVLNSGEMPPEDETQPKAKAKTDFLDDLSHQLVTARKSSATPVASSRCAASTGASTRIPSGIARRVDRSGRASQRRQHGLIRHGGLRPLLFPATNLSST